MDRTLHSAEQLRLCALLRGLREEAGLAQWQLGELLDAQQSMVTKYEAGERRIDVFELRQILEQLDVDLVSFWKAFENGATTADQIPRRRRRR